jgi:hypothetical protein
LDCKLESGSHAGRIGPALTGDVERSAVVRRSPGERQPQCDVNRAAERCHLDRSHPYIVIRRQDGVEFTTHGSHEYRVRRKWSCRLEGSRCRRENPRFLISKQAGFSSVRIQRAQGNPRPRHSPPLVKSRLDHLSGPDHPIHGEQRGNIPKSDVRGDQDHPESGSPVPGAVSRQHHGHIDIAGEMGQPFGVSRVGEAGQVEGVFVGGSGDDCVYFAFEGESGGGFNRVAGDPAGPDGAMPVGTFTRTQAPAAHAHPTFCGNAIDLIFGSNQRHIGVKPLCEGERGYLGADSTWVTQTYCDPGPPFNHDLIST